MILQLFIKQVAVVKVADGDAQQRIIERGIRQGCPLSQHLFTICIEMMTVEALESILKKGLEWMKN